MPIVEPTNGEPGTVWVNETGRRYYQIIPNLPTVCAACLQWAYQVKPGPWPIPLHRGCRCGQEPIDVRQRAPHAFADFRKMLDEMPHWRQANAMGKSVYNLLERGVIDYKDVVSRYRVRSLREIVANKKLSIATMEANGVRPHIAEAAHAAVHTEAQEIVRAARAQSLAALEKAGVHQQALIEVLAKTLSGRAQIVGGNVGTMATTAGFEPRMSAQAQILAKILAGWRPPGGGGPGGGAGSPAKPKKPKPTAPTAPREPGQFASHSDLEAWRARALPGTKLVNPEAIPIDSWNTIATELSDLAITYPGAAAEIKEITTDAVIFGKAPRAMASTSILGDRISFNAPKWQSTQEAKDFVKLNSESGWLVSGVDDPRYLVTHEFGHVVDAWMERAHPELYKEMRAVIAAPGGYPYVDADKAYSVSSYAATDDLEMIAEIFAMINHLPRSSLPPVAQEVSQLIKKAIAK